MYKNVLLFGARGHLSRTKLIPALKSSNIKYIPLTRQHTENLDIYANEQNIAFMSIPTKHFFNCIQPYEDFILKNKPLIVIEKPHGTSEDEFYELYSYFLNNDLKVIYNDHYIAKHSVLNLDKMDLPQFSQIRSIDFTLHESGCVNDRISYFDEVGILLDMYQSHVLIVLSILLAKMENISRLNALRHIAKCIPFNKKFSTYESYKGQAFTKCDLTFNYKGVDINVSCGKKLTDEKSICLHKNDGGYLCIDLSNRDSNPYTQIFTWLMEDKLYKFLSNEEIACLWKHINLL
jgi:glucose-6-phosphate 1-dehydrogenase